MMSCKVIKNSSLSALMASLLALPFLVQAAPPSDTFGVTSTDKFHRHYNVMEQRPESDMKPYWIYRHPASTNFHYHRSYAELQQYTGIRNSDAYRLTSPIVTSTIY